MESIIKNYSAKMKNGVHDTWTSDKFGTFYKFYIEFENGDKGEASAKDPKPNWKIGGKYTYECKESQYGKVFSSIKSTDNPYGGKGSGVKNPWFPKEHPNEWALEIARKLENSKIGIEVNGVPYIPTASSIASVAGWVMKLIEKYDKNAIECAFTSASALALNSKIIVASTIILEDVGVYDTYLKSSR